MIHNSISPFCRRKPRLCSYLLTVLNIRAASCPSPASGSTDCAPHPSRHLLLTARRARLGGVRLRTTAAAPCTEHTRFKGHPSHLVAPAARALKRDELARAHRLGDAPRARLWPLRPVEDDRAIGKAALRGVDRPREVLHAEGRVDQRDAHGPPDGGLSHEEA